VGRQPSARRAIDSEDASTTRTKMQGSKSAHSARTFRFGQAAVYDTFNVHGVLSGCPTQPTVSERGA
jgi:hypothetical protein